MLVGLAAVPSSWAQIYTVLYTFTGGTDGAAPGGLVRDSAGSLYGTTRSGGQFGYGTVFKLSRKGQFSVLHAFANGADGNTPGGLVMDSAGDLYGSAAGGGRFNSGTIFKLANKRKFSVLYSFTGGADGKAPSGGFVWDADGNLYGTTYGGGDEQDCGGGCGVVFKLDTNGNQTVLYTFSDFADGQQPSAGLTLGPDGRLYGTTDFGGNINCGDLSGNGCGVAFDLDMHGNETVFRSFEYSAGDDPTAGLIRDAAGNFYGTTVFGGYGSPTAGGNLPCGGTGCGVAFKLDKEGGETVLHRFTGGADGAAPLGLIADSVGNLYGATVQGGRPGCEDYACGVVFKLDQSGTETVLHTFDDTSFGPEAGIIMDSAGNIYGTTTFGGGGGVVFKITP